MDHQLAIIQNLMESERHVKEISSTNEKLRFSLATRAEILKRLQQLSLASAALLNSVDSGSSQTEPSSLQILTKVGDSNAVTPEAEETELDLSKAIVGKFLSQLMALVVQTARPQNRGLDLVLLVQLELKLKGVLQNAEEKEVIPKTEEKGGWKKNFARHQPIYTQILQAVNESGGEGSEPELDVEEDDE
jgi:hypothetical protein